MIFDINERRETVPFDEVAHGGIFKTTFSDRYYMKIYPIDGYNAVDISNGDGTKIEDSQKTILVEYQLTITEE